MEAPSLTDPNDPEPKFRQLLLRNHFLYTFPEDNELNESPRIDGINIDVNFQLGTHRVFDLMLSCKWKAGRWRWNLYCS